VAHKTNCTASCSQRCRYECIAAGYNCGAAAGTSALWLGSDCSQRSSSSCSCCCRRCSCRSSRCCARHAHCNLSCSVCANADGTLSVCPAGWAGRHHSAVVLDTGDSYTFGLNSQVGNSNRGGSTLTHSSHIPPASLQQYHGGDGTHRCGEEPIWTRTRSDSTHRSGNVEGIRIACSAVTVSTCNNPLPPGNVWAQLISWV
jgi:hypothetical protein